MSMSSDSQATTKPDCGVTSEPCCNLMVMVPLDGLVHVIVMGSLATIDNPAAGT